MQRQTTAILLTCAAIGVAGGLVFVLEGLISGTVAAAAPFLYGATLGVYFLPGAIAMVLLRRPGVALLSAVIAGVVVSPFTSISVRAIAATALIGALQELPYAITRYRKRPVWLLYLGAVVAGAIFSAVVLVAFDVVSLAPGLQFVAVLSSVLAPVVFTAIGHAIALGVARTGAARSLAWRPAPRS
ncbi:ECF transporter S component [Amnibacterium flavum]|uniref:Acyl esterase n=1 Tax=Amnibacterium flavum TaxID=2173173 RepID=A0A2V1HXC2_9MICO|nr:ECF transporter S component [Amnibacterium flavum]PVZ95277.1 acyl esterase [Amnibacterium flavum]